MDTFVIQQCQRCKLWCMADELTLILDTGKLICSECKEQLYGLPQQAPLTKAQRRELIAAQYCNDIGLGYFNLENHAMRLLRKLAADGFLKQRRDDSLTYDITDAGRAVIAPKPKKANANE